MSDPDPVEVRHAYNQTIQRYESVMYGRLWTCTCEEYQRYRGNQCWHIAAVAFPRKYWTPQVAKKVAEYEAG